MERDTQPSSGGTAAGFDRISHNPLIMGGKPIIRGMRVTVGMVLGELGRGATIDEILDDFPYLEREDILQSIRYGAWLAQERIIDLAVP
jgi:uncharacterized protein (DUF433 family)